MQKKETQEVAASPLLYRHPRCNHVDPSSIHFAPCKIWLEQSEISLENPGNAGWSSAPMCLFIYSHLSPSLRSPVLILQFCTRQQHANPRRRRGKLSFRRAEQQSDPNKRSVRKMFPLCFPLAFFAVVRDTIYHRAPAPVAAAALAD